MTRALAALGRRWLGPPGEPATGWLEHRLRLGVCEGAAELGDLLWLECNAAELNGVSFSKGCFVGQENTARMNWRAKVNRRLFVVEGGAPARARFLSGGRPVGGPRAGRIHPRQCHHARLASVGDQRISADRERPQAADLGRHRGKAEAAVG